MSSTPPPLAPWRLAWRTILHRAWWRQQTWVATTEVLTAFLAAIGTARGLSLQHVALGLALAYGVSAVLVRPLVHGSRQWAVGALGLATLSLGVGGWWPASSLGSWWGLCMACGTLLAVRDGQTVHSMTWLPVRAARRHTNAVRVAQWALVLSTVYLMAWLGVSGLILSHWSHWPVLLMALALGLGFPQVIASRPRRRQWRQRRRRPSPLTLTARVELRWMYRLTITLNAAQFLGRRLVLPTALLGMLAGWGWEAHALPVLGLALGGVALLGALLSVWVGQHTDHQRPEAQAMMGRGLGLTVLGWLLIVLGLVLAAVHAAAWIAVLMGWVLIDMAARLLGVGYMEAMRFAVIEEQTTRGRVHRHALSRFMRMKSVGSVVGLTLAGLTASWGPLVLPVWLAVWIVACWWLWHQRPWQT